MATKQGITESVSRMKLVVLVIFLAGLALSGALGTGTWALLQWPGLVALGLAGFLSIALWSERPRRLPGRWCLLAVAGCGGYLLARAMTSPVAYEARGDLLLVLAGLVVFGLTAVSFTGSRERMVIFWCLVALGGANLVVGAIQLSGDGDFTIIPGYSRTYPDGRLGGFFNNPNHLGALLGFTALLVLGQAVFGRGGAAARLLLLFVCALMILGLALSLSRGALIGLVAGLLAFLFFGGPELRRLLAGIPTRFRVAASLAATGAVATGVILNLSLLRERLPADGIFQETARFQFWKAALDQFEANPVLGAGSRAYSWLSRLYRPEDLFTAEGEIEFAHNEYLQLAADYGLVGLLLFGAAVGLCLVNAARFLRRGPGMSRARIAMAAGSAAGLVALFVHAVFDFHFHIPAVALPAAFAFGVLANPGFDERRGGEGGSGAGRWLQIAWKAGCVLAGGVLVFLGTDLGRSEFFLERAERLQEGQPGLGGVALMARARELDPRNPRIFLASARAWEARAEEGLSPAARRSFLERAREDYEEACRLHPFDIYSLVPLANCLDALGMGDEARARYEEAMRWAPRFQYCQLSYGMFLHRSGDWAGAAEVYRGCYRAHALKDIDGSMARVRELEAILERDRRRGTTK